MVKKIFRALAKSSKNSRANSRHYSRTVKVSNELGIHARSAALLAKTANQYQADVTVEKGSNRINGKSIMGLLTLAAAKGTQLKISTQGPDALEALEQIARLVEDKFGEK